MKRIMILGASILQVPIIKEAKNMNLDVVVLDQNPNAIGFKIEGIKKEIISTIDKKAVLSKAIEYNIDGIVTAASDMPMQTVAYVSSKLELPGISQSTARFATIKSEMRRQLKLKSVEIPKFYEIYSWSDFISLATEINKTYILKPIDSSGSRGVSIVKPNETMTDLRKIYDYSLEFTQNKVLIFEEYMIGPEVSVETITYKGETKVIQITDKITTGPPNFVEMGHIQPSSLDTEILSKIELVTKKAIDAIELINGPAHTEIIITDEGPKIVEIGARLGGDNITSHLVPLSTSINVLNITLKIALGEKLDKINPENKSSVILYLSSNQGILKNISGVTDALLLDGIEDVVILKAKGDKINNIKNSTDRIGYVISKANTRNEAINIAKRALGKIKLEVESSE